MQHVKLDPDGIFPPVIRDKFRDLLLEYDDIFNPEFSGCNGAVGPYQAIVNMGPVQPPQRKGCVPQYARNKLEELQKKFDDLEEKGVFQCPEKLDIVVEYLNPSFLVKKASGGFRLVTAFADVGRYSKPQPALMPDVLYTATNCTVELYHCVRHNWCLLPDSVVTFVDEVLWCGDSFPWSLCVHEICHGHARVGDSIRRAHEPHPR